MKEVASLFLDASREYLADTYLGRIERAVATVRDEDLWWKPHEGSNAIGNLLLHLEGNVRQWILSGIGGAPDQRERALEFTPEQPLEERPGREALLARLGETVRAASAVLAGLDGDALTETRNIQGYELTLLEAIYHVVEHFSWHTGQITAIAKDRAGAQHGLAFYDESRVNSARNDA